MWQIIIIRLDGINIRGHAMFSTPWKRFSFGELPNKSFIFLRTLCHRFFFLTFLLFRLPDLVSGTRSFQRPRNGLMSIGFSPQPVSIPRGNSFANGRIFCKKKIKTWKVGSLSPPASGDLVASQVWYSLPNPNPDSTFRFEWSKLFKTDKLDWLVQSNPYMVKWSTVIYLVIY